MAGRVKRHNHLPDLPLFAIGEALGRRGMRDLVALRRFGLFAIGAIVDQHRKARGLRLGDILDADLRGDAEVGGQGSKIAHASDLLLPRTC